MRFLPSSHCLRLGGVAYRATPSRIATVRLPFSAQRFQSLLTLAIETSCDDTCVAVLEKNESGAARLLFNKKITSDHKAFGGIHPLMAVKGHVRHLAGLVDEAIQALPKCESYSSPSYLYVGSAKHRLRIPDFISVTRGPGMPTNLSVGLSMAKGLATAWQTPLLGIHHMQAHALTPRMFRPLALWEEEDTQESAASTPLPPPVNFPFLSLLVSGGHTLLVKSESVMEHSTVAETPNTALGNFIDAVAKVILPKEVIAESPGVSFGPILERFAFPPEEEPNPEDDGTQAEVGKYRTPASPGNYNYRPPPTRREEGRIYDSGLGWTLTPPLHKPDNKNKMDEFDFAGLKGQVRLIAENKLDMSVEERRHLARATMAVAFEHAATRVAHVLAEMQEKTKEESKQRQYAKEDGATVGPEPPQHMPDLVVSGGVASNQFLLHVLRKFLDARGFVSTHIIAPPIEYCTDNAAMIAWTGMEMWELGLRSTLDIEVIKTWPLGAINPDQGSLGTEGNYYVPLASTFGRDEVVRREELRQKAQREPQVIEQLNMKAPGSAGSGFVEWQTRVDTEVARLTRVQKSLGIRFKDDLKSLAMRVSFAERKIEELNRQRMKSDEASMAMRLDDLEVKFQMLINRKPGGSPEREVGKPRRKQVGDYPDSLLTHEDFSRLLGGESLQGDELERKTQEKLEQSRLAQQGLDSSWELEQEANETEPEKGK